MLKSFRFLVLLHTNGILNFFGGPQSALRAVSTMITINFTFTRFVLCVEKYRYGSVQSVYSLFFTHHRDFQADLGSNQTTQAIIDGVDWSTIEDVSGILLSTTLLHAFNETCFYFTG